MKSRINESTIHVPLTSENNMQAIKNFILGDKKIEDEIVLVSLTQLALGFILTSSIITIVAQIGLQYKAQEKRITDAQIQQLESVKYYYKVLTKDKSCIYLRNCISVVESIIVTISEYFGLNSDQRREKFLEEVERLNSSGIPARLLTNPNENNILVHRKAMSLRIRSRCQADPIYKIDSILSSTKSVWDNVSPESFLISFERCTALDSMKIIEKLLIQEKSNCIESLIANKIFSMFKSEDIRFDESIGVNTVPFETLMSHAFEKHITRLKINGASLVSLEFKDPADPLIKLLELQKRKLQQPGGLKSDKRSKR